PTYYCGGRIAVPVSIRSHKLMRKASAFINALNWVAWVSVLAYPWSSALAVPSTQPTTKPISQSDDGSILLYAKDVIIHGATVRYEPQPNKNTVGYWTKKDDWISWDFTVNKPGKFELIALQGCGKGSGGAEVEFTIDKQTLKMTVEDTGHFQNFIP